MKHIESYTCAYCNKMFKIFSPSIEGEVSFGVIECPFCFELTNIKTFRYNILFDRMIHYADQFTFLNRKAWSAIKDSFDLNSILYPLHVDNNNETYIFFNGGKV